MIQGFQSIVYIKLTYSKSAYVISDALSKQIINIINIKK